MSKKKKFWKIGEVAEMVGVEPHVLRFWETEFLELSPSKSRGGQRLYCARDIAIVCEIQKLLHTELFTIKGAKKQLKTFFL